MGANGEYGQPAAGGMGISSDDIGVSAHQNAISMV
jgi:hypothetical protein